MHVYLPLLYPSSPHFPIPNFIPHSPLPLPLPSLSTILPPRRSSPNGQPRLQPAHRPSFSSMRWPAPTLRLSAALSAHVASVAAELLLLLWPSCARSASHGCVALLICPQALYIVVRIWHILLMCICTVWFSVFGFVLTG
jgi:hypothetical protein